MRVLGAAVILAVILAAAGCAATKGPGVVAGDRLVERDGLWYETGSSEPFTGTMVEYWPGGGKKAEIELVGGRVHGKMTEWYEDGGKASETEYHEGELHGTAVGWDEEGRKLAEVEFSGGEEVGRREWDEEGNPVGQ